MISRLVIPPPVIYNGKSLDLTMCQNPARGEATKASPQAPPILAVKTTPDGCVCHQDRRSSFRPPWGVEHYSADLGGKNNHCVAFLMGIENYSAGIDGKPMNNVVFAIKVGGVVSDPLGGSETAPSELDGNNDSPVLFSPPRSAE